MDLLRSVAAINHEDGTCHEAGGIGGQEQDGLGDFVGSGDAAQGDVAGKSRTGRCRRC